MVRPTVKALGKGNSSVRAEFVPRGTADLKTRHCFAFRDGNCTLGRDCSYSHSNPTPKVKQPALAPKAKASTATTSLSTAGSKPCSNQVCHDFLNGRCTRNHCKFQHVARAAVGAMIQI